MLLVNLGCGKAHVYHSKDRSSHKEISLAASVSSQDGLMFERRYRSIGSLIDIDLRLDAFFYDIRFSFETS